MTATTHLSQPARFGRLENRRYDFHWVLDRVPHALGLCRQYQQDALQYTFPGLVGGMDGSACVRTDRMGAGFALGPENTPPAVFSTSRRTCFFLTSGDCESPALLETRSRKFPRSVRPANIQRLQYLVSLISPYEMGKVGIPATTPRHIVF